MISSGFSVRLSTAGLAGLLAAASAAAPGGPMSSAQAAARPAMTGRAAQGTAPASTQVAGAEPLGRQWTSFAYDLAHRELVMFGGNRVSTVFGDTWTRKSGMWTQQHPARSPSARTGAAMVYDAATGQLLLFGGSARPGTGGGYNAETWTWAGTTWRRLHPATSPSPRDSESLVYDPASQAAIMFGGFSSSTGRLSDTWSWDGSTWTQLHPPASPGVLTVAWQAAYDPASAQLLLFGGDPGNGSPPLSGTWAWTGTTWTQLTPLVAPGGRAYGSMTYNPGSQRIYLAGGSSNGPENRFSSTTWFWNGSIWHRTS